MLSDINGGCGEIEMAKKPQRCKPDFEGMIASARKRLLKTVSLKDALFDYIGSSRVRDKLAEMVGELVWEERQINARIEELINEQENYKE